MPIHSVDEFVEAVGGNTTENAMNQPEPVDSQENPIHWGPATSMEGGDAFARLGIETNLGAGSSGKIAAFHGQTAQDLQQQRHHLVKEAFMFPTVRRAAQGAGKAVGNMFGRIAGGTAGKTAPKLTGMAAVRNRAPGWMTDAGIEGHDVAAGAAHKPTLFERITGGSQ